MLQGMRNFDRLPEIWRCKRHTRDWLRLSSSYVGLRVPLPFQVTLPSGSFEFLEPSDIATFWQVFYRGIYPVHPSDRFIVDAGANIGAFSLFALGAAPEARVVAIEPAPDSFQRLQSMLRVHQLESRCTLHRAALGEAEGETFIELAPASQFRRTGTSGCPVPMRTLDNLISENAIVDLLKMDVEGAEYAVFRSISRDLLRRIRRIVMEFHPPAAAAEAIAPLEAAGFAVSHYQDDGNGYGVVRLERH